MQALLRAVALQDSAVGWALLAQVESLSMLRKKEERVAAHAEQASRGERGRDAAMLAPAGGEQRHGAWHGHLAGGCAAVR